MTDPGGTGRAGSVGPYVPQVVQRWLLEEPDRRWREVDASLVRVDISGFTALSEQLAARGQVGAEQLTDVINRVFSALLERSYAAGGRMLKFGGDAILVLFDGERHAARAARAAAGMRDRLAEVGRVAGSGASGASVQLAMRVGVRSGATHLLLVGGDHHELLVCGPAATEVVGLEAAAGLGEVLVSPATAALLDPDDVGSEQGPGRLLLRTPDADEQVVEPPPAVDDAALLAGVPTGLRAHLEHGAGQEHRRATVGFLHLDAPAGEVAADPDAVWERLDATVRLVQSAADAHDVAVLASDVDADAVKLVLAAGAPTSTGEDEERLLLTVRELLDAEPPAAVRAGAAVGHVFAGDVGPDYRRTYTVMGDTVNLAARLMAQAPSGELVVTEELHERSRTRFDTEDLGELEVRGRAAGVRALRVGAVQARRVSTGGGQLPLVGRDVELAQLQAAIDAARAGAGRAVDVVGDAGIGKSRLVQEALEQADDVRVVTVVGEPYRSAIPYAAVRRLLRDALGLPGPDGGPDGSSDGGSGGGSGGESGGGSVDAAGELHRVLAADLPELLPWAPLLGDVLGVEVASTPEVDALDPRYRRPRVHEVVTDVLRWAWSTPTVLVVEDVPWVDEASRELLRSIAAQAAEQPWTVLATCRDRDIAIADDDGEVLALEPLSAEVVARLGGLASDTAPVPPHVLEQLAERSGGNPLFLEELLAAAATFGAGGLPDSVDAVVTSRIDGLPAPARRTLRQLAVLGAEVDRGFAARVLGSDGASIPMLGQLEGFVDVDADRLRFRHSLLRDAAYNGLPYRERRRLHARAADLLGDDGQVELRSVHAFLAGRMAEAWEASVAAGQAAAEVYANADAARFFARALEAGSRLRSVPVEERAGVAELLGDVLRHLGDGGAAADTYRRARRWRADDPVTAARLSLKQARAQAGRERFSAALSTISRALQRLEGVDSAEAGAQRAQLLVWYGHFRQEQGRDADALFYCERAIAEAEAVGEKDALAHALRLRDWAHAERGEPELAVHSSRALKLYEELGDLSAQAGVLNNLGAFAFWAGRWEEAVQYYRRAQELDERTGDVLGAAFGRNNLAEILLDQGQLDEATELLRAAERTFRAADYVAGVAYVGMNLGRCAARAGDMDEARGRLERSVSGFTTVGAAANAVEAAARLAEVEVVAGDADWALAEADRLLREAESGDSVAPATPLLHRVRGEALLNRGEIEPARLAFAMSIRAARSRDSDHDVALAEDGLARVMDAADEDGWVLRQRSEATFERLGVSVPATPPTLVVGAVPQSRLGLGAEERARERRSGILKLNRDAPVGGDDPVRGEGDLATRVVDDVVVGFAAFEALAIQKDPLRPCRDHDKRLPVASTQAVRPLYAVFGGDVLPLKDAPRHCADGLPLYTHRSGADRAAGELGALQETLVRGKRAGLERSFDVAQLCSARRGIDLDEDPVEVAQALRGTIGLYGRILVGEGCADEHVVGEVAFEVEAQARFEAGIALRAANDAPRDGSAATEAHAFKRVVGRWRGIRIVGGEERIRGRRGVRILLRQC